MNMQASAINIYSVIKPRTFLAELPILLSFNLLLVATAYISIELPFSPVPITGQTLGVLLIAMLLGKVRGTAVVSAYLLEGIAGLPVFAGGQAGILALVGPTGGYLIGFLVAAYCVGSLADKQFDRSYLKSVLAMTLGTAIIFFFGLLGLSRFGLASDLSVLLQLGLIPFIPGAVIKIGLASVILPSIWKKISSPTSSGNDSNS